jgi:hypothetical protein
MESLEQWEENKDSDFNVALTRKTTSSPCEADVAGLR